MVEKLPIAKAIGLGLRDAMRADDKVLIMGEDVGRLGGVFRVTDGLFDEFGGDRVVDTPLSEASIIGTAIGLAFRGYRANCEIQFDGFVFPAFNQITTQLAKMHNRTEGRVRVPVVIRIPYGGAIGAVEHHSESPEAYFTHTAGLRVITPSTANDAYWMTRQAIECEDPVIVFEPKRHYWLRGEVDLDHAPEESAFQARIARPGEDATVVAWGPTVSTALEAAALAEEEGRSVEVIDLRSLNPIDMPTVIESVQRTGRLVVVHEAPVFGGLGGEIAARVTEQCFYHLEAPVQRVGGCSTPYPPARMERHYLPDAERVLDAVTASFAY
ncbi:alpha-ketoacid dehydrogenase subunit beta [Helcobacillus massiliensis]|uniref:3-methyl-2-oxobutanoate dehydrogenase (2-methylpropanoyl-transferring) n=1 Tax=Helcobacillus massiliensis TaxID=521392 RepID=A0A839QT60_9MICO|nr:MULTISPECIES: alpha-ketoacid dehydrogenase subunit beta [Helcobacillus]MBB3023252.1 pyruvate dehydrogenase E1 component beta subunit [Helcobacillus massiliensis]MCG7427680.1 alpha-ketoacid dehydrogenase subunit beta [Helcobacillus sp. ACRRO]MCT1556573.1 alpha-ketoacid dehydrogenase subunit beta [Helcobacillus massiliensis]MCT2035767.1 alpha-ketoacid dehydrogenase subunit beta [Helcobacillus massiliensis]MCT2331151.1 alpha-ketoacid dehydrogenase subunit beta [Helcobacillus massiliensis]